MNEQKGEIAYNLHREISDNELQRRKLLLKNMKVVLEMKESNLYQAIVGDEQAPFTAYLAQLEVYYSRNKIRSYEKIIKKFNELDYKVEQVIDVPFSRLKKILNILTKENIEEWIEKARTFPSLAWRDEIRQLKGLIPTDACEHREVEVYEICKSCGHRHKKN